MKKQSSNIAILILAAGSSSRLGRPKQLLELQGKTLLQKSIESALEVSQNVVVVLGANEQLIQPTISEYQIEIVLNNNWENGMSSSIQTGMSIIDDKNYEAVLIMLCDQPFVDAPLLKKMIETFRQSEATILASSYENKIGVPAIFHSNLFPKLRQLSGQQGAKFLIKNNLEQTQEFTFEKGIIDIDTEAAWENYKKRNSYE